jgi:hypothetical protein
VSSTNTAFTVPPESNGSPIAKRWRRLIKKWGMNIQGELISISIIGI